MTQKIFELPTAELVELFLHIQQRRRLAVRAFNTPEVNRWVRKSVPVQESLASTPGGRVALESLLTQADPYILVRAAGVVIKWAPEKAIPIFASMLDADLSSIDSPDERLDIRQTSKEWLFSYFGITNADRNALIEAKSQGGL